MTDPSAFDELFTATELRAMGAQFNPDILGRTRELYRGAVMELPWAGRSVACDLAYGNDKRHRLDAYPADTANAPVVVFVHGGGFVAGDKRGDDQFYANVGRYFAAHGFLAVLPNYRLAPDFTWPSGNEDMAGVLNWITLNAKSYGGDEQRIMLVGQSAGAAHIAGYLFDPRFNGRSNKAIRAAALLSGFYRAKEGMLAGPKLYAGDDPSQWPDRSPVTHVTSDHPALLLSVAELDPAQVAEQTLDLAMTLNSTDGRPPRLVWFEGQNHVSTVHGLGLGKDAVGQALRNFAEMHV